MSASPAAVETKLIDLFEGIRALVLLLLGKRFRGQAILHFDGEGVPKIEVKTAPMAPGEMTKLLG